MTAPYRIRVLHLIRCPITYDLIGHRFYVSDKDVYWTLKIAFEFADKITDLDVACEVIDSLGQVCERPTPENPQTI